MTDTDPSANTALMPAECAAPGVRNDAFVPAICCEPSCWGGQSVVRTVSKSHPDAHPSSSSSLCVAGSYGIRSRFSNTIIVLLVPSVMSENLAP